MIIIILSSLTVWLFARIFFGPEANRLFIYLELTEKSFAVKVGQGFTLTILVLILKALS